MIKANEATAQTLGQLSKVEKTMTPVINLDTLKKDNWNATEQQNAALVVEFVQLIMNDHDFDQVLSRFGSQPYRQHNRSMTDGISGVVKSVSDLCKQSPEFSYDVKHIYVDGENVILHSHATLKRKHRGDDKQGFNIMDVWKVVDGKIVEHWDTVQPMSFSMRMYMLVTGGAIRNDNGVY